MERLGASSSTLAQAVAVGLLALLVLLVLYWTWACMRTGRRRGGALCGWTFYSMPGCGHCKEQEAALSAAKLGGHRRVVCGAGAAAECEGIPAFPFWKNAETGATRLGFQNVGQLKEMERECRRAK